MADKFTTTRNEGVVEHYLISCPDVIEFAVAGRPHFSGKFTVGLDGRINLGEYGKPRVEGHTIPDLTQLIAELTGTRPEDVRIRVADFNSQHLFLFGQVIGWQRTVPYRGQETVVDLLQRVGGITQGAAPEDVHVVRPHLGDGQRPEVFHVDLAAIVMKHDFRTNLRLLPSDQVYVGETRQARIEKCIPPWFRPLYQTLWGTRPHPAASPQWALGSQN